MPMRLCSKSLAKRRKMIKYRKHFTYSADASNAEVSELLSDQVNGVWGYRKGKLHLMKSIVIGLNDDDFIQNRFTVAVDFVVSKVPGIFKVIPKFKRHDQHLQPTIQ